MKKDTEFSIKLTMRVYDRVLMEQLDNVFAQVSGEYESKNRFLNDLLRYGIEDFIRVKGLAVKKPQPAAITVDTHTAEQLEQIKRLIEDMAVNSKQQAEDIVIRLSVSGKLSASIYNMLLAIMEDEPLSAIKLEQGFYDDLPERFKETLKEILSAFDSGKSKQ